MIKRDHYSTSLATATARFPVTALLGPRQSDKTTLARIFGKHRTAHYFDLESPADQQGLQNPELMLGSLQGMIVLDEIQIKPEFFNVLRVSADNPENQSHFLVLGSASPYIIKNVSETLAGRVELIELAGFNIQGINNIEQLWFRGGFPRSFLAASEDDSLAWRDGFMRTFLERDIPMLGITIASPAMRRFRAMPAYFHGQIWNASELGRSMD